MFPQYTMQTMSTESGNIRAVLFEIPESGVRIYSVAEAESAELAVWVILEQEDLRRTNIWASARPEDAGAFEVAGHWVVDPDALSLAETCELLRQAR